MSRLWAVLVGFLAMLTVAGIAPTTTASAAIFAYDALAISRVDARASADAPAGPAQLSGSREGCATLSLEPRGTSTTLLSRNIATEAVDANVVMGRKGSEMLVESGTNVPGVVNGRAYSAHAFDQMQGRGIMPSVVDDTIAAGLPAASRGATTVYYGAGNNISVVVNAEGKVVTVSYGELRP